MKTLLRKIYLFPVYLYRWCISPFKGGGCCRYTPTCSTYFLEAVFKHGIIKGTILGMARILRCSPPFWGGSDPVPEKFSFRGIRNDYIKFHKPSKRKLNDMDGE